MSSPSGILKLAPDLGPTYWVLDGESYVPATWAQYFVQSLYSAWLGDGPLQFAHDGYVYVTLAPVAGPSFTTAELLSAARNMPNATDNALKGFADAEIVGYIQATVPGWLV